MKFKKFSKEWFKNKLLQYKNMQDGTMQKLTPTKGFKPISSVESKYSKRNQRIISLNSLAKEKGVDISE